MVPDGWQFRTTSGVAEVGPRTLVVRRTPRGLLFGPVRRYRAADEPLARAFALGKPLLRGASLATTATVALGVLAGASLGGVLSLGALAVLALLSVAAGDRLGRTEVPYPELRGVEVDSGNDELTLRAAGDDPDWDGTTVTVPTGEERERALSLLELRGVPVRTT